MQRFTFLLSRLVDLNDTVVQCCQGGNSIKISWRGKRERVLSVSKTSPPGLKGTAFISYNRSIIFLVQQRTETH